jgi:hypothetical protein
MTGPDHYREAERLLAAAQGATDQFHGQHDAIPTLLAAAAHAMLANAAATGATSQNDSREWIRTAGCGLNLDDLGRR